MEKAKDPEHPDHPVDVAVFAAIVDELEALSGRRLRHPLRGRLFRAFTASPEGFRRAVLRARAEAHTNVVGLLGWKIAQGEHLLGATAKPPVRGAGSCYVCGRLTPDALRRGGQWWCSDHEAQAA